MTQKGALMSYRLLPKFNRNLVPAKVNQFETGPLPMSWSLSNRRWVTFMLHNYGRVCSIYDSDIKLIHNMQIRKHSHKLSLTRNIHKELSSLDNGATFEVRSWMEKLKDKAGYMSGMLAPVGVGISGALTILGVLYSIKIINRRRRNGFKQHKRKREFNSMQDRVMLLADSSEDEF
ncbi:armadillo-like helical domain-containing 4 isoform X2 [Pelobates cultripes]|uniref:Armadillo-like helical domain-containing 4 isoform X2 n=1 Tax=Pelobates cultripes TaxID=61616 RepID=A0AAD1TLD9_PELCU|nr:armadillo-like helical domain-containing 4 isoform X2 [Pelobates cultripes]